MRAAGAQRGSRDDRSVARPPRRRRAVAAIYAGDQPTLRNLLHDHPGLARARVAGEEKPYDRGYFHGATLLHHVAGNPNPPTGLVPRAVESARLLLAAGADVIPSLHIDDKRTRIKQYHKEGRALRTETTISAFTCTSRRRAPRG